MRDQGRRIEMNRVLMTCVIALALHLGPTAHSTTAFAQSPAACPPNARGMSGTVGTVIGAIDYRSPYLICIPPNFNGTVINDLDYVTGAGSASKLQLFRSGYALSGIGRGTWRAAHWDPYR